MFKRLTGLVLVLLLAACASQPILLQQGKLSPPEGQGYAIVALTLNSFDQDRASAWLRLQGPGGNQDLYASITTDTIVAPQKSVIGKLHILPLTPGQYTVKEAIGDWTYTAAGWPQQRHDQLAVGRQFEMKSGEVLYLGEVHLALSFKSSLQLSDQHERDFYALSQQYGISDTSNIKSKILGNHGQ